MMRLPISTQITVTELIRFAWLQQGEWQRNALFDLFISLLRVGCDYYDLIALYAEHEISESELNILNAQAPLHLQILREVFSAGLHLNTIQITFHPWLKIFIENCFLENRE